MHGRHQECHSINFTSCPADPDVWMRPAIKSDGTKVYDYVWLYVDDALVVSENAVSILRNELGRYFELKEESMDPRSLLRRQSQEGPT